MPTLQVGGVGDVGVNKDLSAHDLPINVWTAANNVRFFDGYAKQYLGDRQVYGTPQVVPYHILPVLVAGVQYWIYAGANKIYNVTSTTHTNITRQSAGNDVNYTASRNDWVSTILGGIPVLNNGTDAPQQWLLTGKCTALTNWPASTTCASLKAFRGFLIAMDVTKSGTRYPYMVKWSNRADPGTVPSTWDETDATNDAGEYDLSAGYDYIIDGQELRDSFMIYKRASIWRVDEIGGIFVLKFSKVLGTSGALNKNCIQEIDGLHFVLTNEDVIVHDGFQSKSVLNKQMRRFLFEDIDVSYASRAFVCKNPYYNEMFVCYPSTGNSVPNKALVWNWESKTVSFRDIASLNHASAGPVDVSAATGGDLWSGDSGAWSADTTTWSNSGTTISTARALMASDNTKLLVMDETNTFDGSTISAYVERQGLSLGGDTERRKIVTGIRPRIKGTDGDTVLVYVGGGDDPYETPTYETAVAYTIGTDVEAFMFSESRYTAIKFANGTSTNWRLDGYDIIYQLGGLW